GLNKAETARRFGDEQVLVWRRAYAIAPDPLPDGDERLAIGDPRYAGLDPALLPRTECLKDTVERVVPYWAGQIAPAIRAGKRVLVAAHGNSLRALIKHLDQVGEEEIVHLNIPTARPLVYELDDQLKPLRNYYLGDQAEIEAAKPAVAAQGKARRGRPRQIMSPGPGLRQPARLAGPPHPSCAAAPLAMPAPLY